MKLKHLFPHSLRLFMALCMILTFSLSHAQDDETKAERVSGGFGYFTPGAILLDVDATNTFLGGHGFDENQSGHITLGGGGMVIARNFVLGGEGHSVLGRDFESGVQTLNLRGGWGQFNVGYVLLGKKGMLFYPKLSIGGYNHRMIVKEVGQAPTVDEVFASNDFHGTELVKNGLLLGGSLNFDFMPGFDESAGSGIVIGLELGYNYAATDNGWKIYDTPLNSGPALNMTGAFARLHIGFGGWHRQ